MTTILLLSICCLFIFVIFLIIERILYTDRLRQKFRLQFIFICFFAILSFIAIKQINDYIYPVKPEIFCNADYHTITHSGFLIKDGFTLVDEKHPEESLWDNKTGYIVLNNSNIELRNYDEAFYTKGEHPSRWVLQNPSLDINLNEGFSLNKNGQLFYQLKLEPYNDNKKVYYISNLYRNGTLLLSDTSTFNKKINYGYPLVEIIKQSPRLSNSFVDTMETVFSNTTIVREIIYTESFDRKWREQPNLKICLDKSYFSNKNFKIQGDTTSSRSSITIPYNEEIKFYSGVGTSRSDEMTLKPIDATFLQLNFGLAKRFHLPNWNESTDSLGQAIEQHLFIMSDPLQVVNQDNTKGFVYDVFDSNKNKNHINALLTYTAGDSRQNINFKITDYNNTASGIQNIQTNRTFKIKTGNTACEWEFKIEDLRASNALTPNKIYTFVIIFFLLVSIRIILDKLLDINSLSVTELSVYVILLCFGVIRLILMWRISTFPPISGLTANVWNVMRGNTYYPTIITICLIPISVAIFTTFRVQISNVANLLYGKIGSSRLYNTVSSNQWMKVLIYLLLLLLCWGLNHISRVFNICVPFILYLIINWWIIARTTEERYIFNGKFSFPVERICIVLLLLLYFFISEKGVIPVFLLFLFIKFCIYGIPRKSGLWPSIIICTAATLFTVLSLNYEGEIIHKVFYNTEWNSILTKKALHAKWRAETQRIKSADDLTNLLQQCEHGSSDVEMLMRCAHNQWFISQYIQLGNNNRVNYLSLQPHSNQGSPYPTQTTDLVITRYILAEHGHWVVYLMMTMFLLIVIIYGLEACLYNKYNFAIFGGLLFLYSLALSVCLSATNRIIFIGQDFPLISTTSLTAIIFPVLIFIITIARTAYLRYTCQQTYRDTSAKKEWIAVLVPSAALIFLSISTIFIENKTNIQDTKSSYDTAFDISSHIDKIENALNVINYDFQRYQEDLGPSYISKVRAKHLDAIWTKFTQEPNYNRSYLYYTQDANSDQQFIGTLLKQFTEQQRDKTNPDKLIHLRKNRYVFLDVNKQFYRIARIDKENIQWRGNLLASNDYCPSLNNTDTIKSYEILKIIGNNTKQIVYNKSWEINRTPLRLIYIDQDTRGTESFQIITTNCTIPSFKNNIVATAVPQYSILNIYKTIGSNKTNLTKKQKTDATFSKKSNYLSKNIWINGRQQHFYPQKASCIWDYHFTEWLSSAISRLPKQQQSKYINQDIELTFDYALSDSMLTQAKKDSKTKKFDNVVAVVINGDGKIKTLFNHDPHNKNKIDPNDPQKIIRSLNKNYTEESRKTMRELFGVSSLLPIPSGPGSTFKPIVYTAVTARVPIDWNSLDVNNSSIKKELVISKDTSGIYKGKEVYDYYGGVKLDKPISIENAYGSGLQHDNYIVRSNNLYHSVVVMIGLKNSYRFNESKFNALIMNPDRQHPELSFPTIKYKNDNKCFNPDTWWNDNKEAFIDDGSALSRSLSENFNIQQKTIYDNEFQYSTDFYGDGDIIKRMYQSPNIHRMWASAEVASQNTADRREDPIQEGFNRMFLGAAPLQITPLQMAISALRLSTLNKAEHITTILSNDTINNYEFFDIDDGWESDTTYFNLFKKQVLTQMRKVCTEGTASGLKDLSDSMQRRGLYLYCKTGTLGDPNNTANRIKHLMIIISNTELENLKTIEEFRQAKRYVMYLSFYNVDKDKFNNNWFKPYINIVTNTNSFKNYMNL